MLINCCPTGTYDSGFGPLSSFPYEYQTNSYGHDTNPTNNQQPQFNSYLNSRVPMTNDQLTDTNKNYTGNYGTMNNTQPFHVQTMNNQYADSKNYQQVRVSCKTTYCK